MKLIAHRINTIEALNALPHNYGVEVDIRSWNTELHIHHDPFVKGESFELWLQAYRHSTLILNVKEEGLETRLLELMHQYGITDFFFLDQSFPFLVKWSRQGESRCAVRVSEFEDINTALNLAGKVQWVWVDCFTHFPLEGKTASCLQQAGFSLCLVSPELQGREAPAAIANLANILKMQGIQPDAICTKHPELWERHIQLAAPQLRHC